MNYSPFLRYSEFLFFPYQFSGPQVQHLSITKYFDDNGDDDDDDDGGGDDKGDDDDDDKEPCSSQTLVDTPSSRLCRH